MVPYDDHLQMKERKVAIRPNTTELYLERGEGAPEKSSARRQLYDNWFVDRPGYLEEKINIFDGIEVNITAKDDPERQLDYTWYV